MTFILLILGLLLFALGTELLVRGSAKLAALIKISPLAIGLTIVAYGTSTPELMVSVKAALQNQADFLSATSWKAIFLMSYLSSASVPSFPRWL